jgi:hypothetical protein
MSHNCYSSSTRKLVGNSQECVVYFQVLPVMGFELRPLLPKPLGNKHID